MKKIVKLNEIPFNDIQNVYLNSQWDHIEKMRNKYNENFKKAYDYYFKSNLKYNTQSGKLINKEGTLREYCYKKDIPEYDDIKEIIEDEFLPEILNGASRLTRGYSL